MCRVYYENAVRSGYHYCGNIGKPLILYFNEGSSITV